MKIDINVRGNGACALCAQRNVCRIIKQFEHIGTTFPDRDSPLELVVYACPYFKEKH